MSNHVLLSTSVLVCLLLLGDAFDIRSAIRQRRIQHVLSKYKKPNDVSYINNNDVRYINNNGGHRATVAVRSRQPPKEPPIYLILKMSNADARSTRNNIKSFLINRGNGRTPLMSDPMNSFSAGVFQTDVTANPIQNIGGRDATVNDKLYSILRALAGSNLVPQAAAETTTSAPTNDKLYSLYQALTSGKFLPVAITTTTTTTTTTTPPPTTTTAAEHPSSVTKAPLNSNTRFDTFKNDPYRFYLLQELDLHPISAQNLTTKQLQEMQMREFLDLPIHRKSSAAVSKAAPANGAPPRIKSPLELNAYHPGGYPVTPAPLARGLANNLMLMKFAELV